MSLPQAALIIEFKPCDDSITAAFRFLSCSNGEAMTLQFFDGF